MNEFQEAVAKSENQQNEKERLRLDEIEKRNLEKQQKIARHHQKTNELLALCKEKFEGEKIIGGHELKVDMAAVVRPFVHKSTGDNSCWVYFSILGECCMVPVAAIHYEDPDYKIKYLPKSSCSFGEMTVSEAGLNKALFDILTTIEKQQLASHLRQDYRS